METTSELIKSVPVNIDSKTQKGWIMAGNQKAEVAKFQQQKALELQQIILHPGESIPELTESLAKYRKLHTEMVTAGQSWRGWLTGLALQPSLDIEKQYSPKSYDDYLLLDKKLLALRVEADNKAREGQLKEQEKQTYAAHVKNQYELMVSDLTQRCINEMNTMYISYLKDKVKAPDIQAIKDTISGFTPMAGVKFESKYMTPADRKAIYDSIQKPDYAALMQEMIATVDQKFAGYQHDLKANTVQQVEEQAARELQEIQQETQQNIGVNLLAAKAAETPVILPEGKAVKYSYEVIVEGNEQWHIAVITAYLKNPLCREFVSVKKWENLTVGQMAAALGKYSTEINSELEGLTYRRSAK
jgi:hypothetical protein